MSLSKLKFFEIKDVILRTPDSIAALQLRPVWHEAVNPQGHAPNNCYAVNGPILYLPKRKRGEKFTVTYTEIKQETI